MRRNRSRALSRFDLCVRRWLLPWLVDIGARLVCRVLLRRERLRLAAEIWVQLQLATEGLSRLIGA